MKVIQRCVYDKEFTHLAISETYNNRMNLQMLYLYRNKQGGCCMKLKKWHVCLAIVCILCFGYIMYIMNPEFDDLKRFINPIYEGDKSYRVVNE